MNSATSQDWYVSSTNICSVAPVSQALCLGAREKRRNWKNIDSCFEDLYKKRDYPNRIPIPLVN